MEVSWVADITKDVERQKSTRPDGKSKGSEIDEWLMEREAQVIRYAIIDDENDMLTKQQKHFVQTNSQFGITCKDAERVITIIR